MFLKAIRSNMHTYIFYCITALSFLDICSGQTGIMIEITNDSDAYVGHNDCNNDSIGYLLFSLCGSEFVEHPQTQYAVVGDRATFHCRVQGEDVYWLINNETITPVRPHVREKYEALGFVFSESSDTTGRNHNLSLNVSASETTNNSLIECRVIGHDYMVYDKSEKAYLRVFTNFRELIIKIHSMI